jgi:hypothetical protein
MANGCSTSNSFANDVDSPMTGIIFLSVMPVAVT